MTKLRPINRTNDRQVETERQIISIRSLIGLEHRPMKDFSINTDDAFVKKCRSRNESFQIWMYIKALHNEFPHQYFSTKYTRRN